MSPLKIKRRKIIKIKIHKIQNKTSMGDSIKAKFSSLRRLKIF